MANQRTRRIGDLVREGERSFSFEFFPPRDEAGEEQLWQAIELYASRNRRFGGAVDAPSS